MSSCEHPRVLKLSLLGNTNSPGCSGITLFGISNEAVWPFKMEKEVMAEIKSARAVIALNDRPVDAAYGETAVVDALEFCRLDPDHPKSITMYLTDEEKRAIGVITLARVKQCLVEGYPVVFGLKMYWPDRIPFTHEVDAHLKTEYASLPEINSDLKEKAEGKNWHGYHALIVGFDDSTSSVLCQNSQGADNAPYFRMSYNWICDYEATYDFWMIRLEQKNEDIQLPGKKVAGTTDKSAQDEWKRLHVPDSDSVSMAPTSTIPMLHLTGFDSEMC